MIRRFAPVAAIMLAGCGSTPAPDDAAPSVAVGVQRLTRGTQPEWLHGYGSVGPSTTGLETISVAQPGQVTAVFVTPGAAVRAGQRLLTFTTAPAAVGSYQQAVTTLATAQKARATAASLLTQQLATRDQVAQADKAVSDAQSALAALRRDGAGQPVRTLTAPFAGIVTTMPAALGDRTQPGAPLATVARAGGIIATIGLDPADAARVRVGQPARIARVGGGAAIGAHVLRIDSVLNPRTRMIDVDLAIPAGALLPNEAVDARIAVGSIAGWQVPHQAVVTASGSARIFQVASGKAHAVPVTVRLPGDPDDIVTGSPDPRRPLIVAGAYQVQDGDAVRMAGR